MDTDEHGLTRRGFVAGAAAVAAASAAQPSAAKIGFDADYGTAMGAAEAIRTKKVSSVELTRHVLRRIEQVNPKLNAVILVFAEESLERARQADAALAKGENWGPFHGVPITVKESYGMKGVPGTAGVPEWKDFRPSRNSAAVEKMLGAGAIIVGKTNVPVMLADWQSYNPIYGTTNNPWDVKRIPGGSTGGGAAALAAGLGYLTLGSDIGGSIRMPSHFCGVYGHKPTLELVSMRGHVPPPIDPAVRVFSDLSVGGPMARSAEDLRQALLVIGGADGDDSKAWKWTIPAPRQKRLRDFRVGCVLDDPICPVSSDVAAVLEKAVSRIEQAGAHVERRWPATVQPKAQLDTYQYLLGSVMNTRLPPPVLEQMRAAYKENPKDPLVASAFEPHGRWLAESLGRIQARAAWQAYFETHDVFLCPTGFVAAFPHDHSEPQQARKLDTPAGKRNYMDLLTWMTFATLSGLPATTAPVGLTASGLPVGLQIIGPYLEDATPIEFAAQMAEVVGGFVAPRSR